MDHAEDKAYWQAVLVRVGKATLAACCGVLSADANGRSAAVTRCMEWLVLWKACTLLHEALLSQLRSPGAADPLAAQWAEIVSLECGKRCLEIADVAARWDDGLRQARAAVLNNCVYVASRLVFDQAGPSEKTARPAFSVFAASSLPGVQPTRIPGRQAVAAVVATVKLAEQALRLAARCPLSHWDAGSAGVGADRGTEGPPPQPWTFCYFLPSAAALWLAQRLPTRPGGPPPARLISLLGEDAVPGFAETLLGLLATQRKLLHHWAAAMPCNPASLEDRHLMLQLFQGMECLSKAAAASAMSLAPRLAAQQGGRLSAQRLCDAVAAAVLGTSAATERLQAPYAQWVWQGSPGDSRMPLEAQTAVDLLDTRKQLGALGGSDSMALAAAAVLLRVPVGVGQAEASLVHEQARCLSSVCAILGGQSMRPSGLLLLAMVQGGLMRLLTNWAQQAWQSGFEAETEEMPSVLTAIDKFFIMACQELDRHVKGQGFAKLSAHNLRGCEDTLDEPSTGRMGHRRLAARRAGWARMWQSRREEVLPRMEAAAAWGSRFVVVWSPASRAGSGKRESSGSGSSSSSGSRIRRESGRGVDPAVACQGLQTLPAGEPAVEIEKQEQQQLDSVPACHPATSSCGPLGQVKTELAFSGILCAHPACANFEGSSEAALPLQRCAGCRVVMYCSPSCAKSDWERHRPACNAFRRLRSWKASAVALDMLN